MEYSITKLAKLAGVTTRTLRYYDQIHLLSPIRISNGYRIYGQKEVDRLQQILLYREMGVELKQIASLIDDPNFNRKEVLENHLSELQQEQHRLELLIQNVAATLSSMKGDIKMKDDDKFKGFKENKLDENEAKYGAEIREKYGEDTVNESNTKFRNMSQTDYEKSEELRKGIESALRKAMAEGNPGSEIAQRMCEMHKEWLCIFWPDGMYSKEAHKGMVDMYLADERFKENYEKIAIGATEFLRDAVYIYCR